MRKTINIITILTVILAVLDILTGMSDRLGIKEPLKHWLEFGGLAVVAILNIFSNVKSGEEIKEMKNQNIID